MLKQRTKTVFGHPLSLYFLGFIFSCTLLIWVHEIVGHLMFGMLFGVKFKSIVLLPPWSSYIDPDTSTLPSLAIYKMFLYLDGFLVTFIPSSLLFFYFVRKKLKWMHFMIWAVINSFPASYGDFINVYFIATGELSAGFDVALYVLNVILVLDGFVWLFILIMKLLRSRKHSPRLPSLADKSRKE